MQPDAFLKIAVPEEQTASAAVAEQIPGIVRCPRRNQQKITCDVVRTVRAAREFSSLICERAGSGIDLSSPFIQHPNTTPRENCVDFSAVITIVPLLSVFNNEKERYDGEKSEKS